MIQTILAILYYGLPGIGEATFFYLYLFSSIASLLSFLWTTALSYHSYGLMTRMMKFNQRRFYNISLLVIYPFFLLLSGIDFTLRTLDVSYSITTRSSIYLSINLVCLLFSISLYIK